MHILVTGSRGFLGKFLSRRLEEEGHTVVGVHSSNCDLTDPASLHQFNDQIFDQIFHLAAWTQAGDFCLHHPAEQWVINQKINTHVIDWWQSHQPQAKLIAMGTSCAYDEHQPLQEEYYFEGKPIDSLFTYGMTKRMLLAGLMAHAKQHQLRYNYFIPSTMYGPEYHTDGRQMHFIFDLIRKILRAKFYGEVVVLWGDGEQKRELVAVEDFVTTMLYLVNTQDNLMVNIGAGQEYSIKEFAAAICEHVGYPVEKITYDTSKYVGARSKVLNIDRLRRLMPHYAPRGLKEGLAATIDWMIEKREILIPENG